MTTSILERSDSCLKVELIWDEETEELSVKICEYEKEDISTVIDGENAMDAFDHPYIYLDDVIKARKEEEKSKIVERIKEYSMKVPDTETSENPDDPRNDENLETA